LEADNGAWKVALYFRTVSESTPGEATTTPSFYIRTHCACSVESRSRGFAASRSLRRKARRDTGVLSLRSLGGPRMSGVCSGRHNLSSKMSWIGVSCGDGVSCGTGADQCGQHRCLRPIRSPASRPPRQHRRGSPTSSPTSPTLRAHHLGLRSPMGLPWRPPKTLA
jgi:hypothetical protein